MYNVLVQLLGRLNIKTKMNEPRSVDLSSITVKALGQDTLHELCLKLNAKKILTNDNGHLRDWRGLAQLVGLPADEIAALDWLQNPCYKVLEMWSKIKNPVKSPNLANLLEILRELDRWDVADDTQALMERDAEAYLSRSEVLMRDDSQLAEILTEEDVWRREQGLLPQMYDALLLYAPEDLEKATLVCEILEKKGLKICVKERDLMVGVFEHSAMLKLIADRCNRVVAVFSNAFLQTSLNRFLVSYAQSVGIHKDCRKVIPVTFEEVTVPSELNYNFRLKYSPSNTLYNFEDKLFRSVCPSNMIPPPEQHSSRGVIPKTTKLHVGMETHVQTAQEKRVPTNKSSALCETLPDVPDHDPMESGYQSDSSKESAKGKAKKKSKIKNLIKRFGKKGKTAVALPA